MNSKCSFHTWITYKTIPFYHHHYRTTIERPHKYQSNFINNIIIFFLSSSALTKLIIYVIFFHFVRLCCFYSDKLYIQWMLFICWIVSFSGSYFPRLFAIFFSLHVRLFIYITPLFIWFVDGGWMGVRDRVKEMKRSKKRIWVCTIWMAWNEERSKKRRIYAEYGNWRR